MGEVRLVEMSSNRVRDIVQGKEEYPVKTKKFWVPELELIAPFVKKELENNFKNVSVFTVSCPDLTKFGCPSSGLGGNSKLVEGGGEPFNHDVSYNKEVHFKMERMAQLAGHGPGSYIQGAGAACAAQLRGHIGELVPCLVVGGANLTKAARVGVKKEAIIEEDKTLMCGGISNLYLCQGKKEGLDFDPSAGGHYHGDIEPEQVSYTGYFSLAHEVVRIWDAVEQKLGDIN